VRRRNGRDRRAQTGRRARGRSAARAQMGRLRSARMLKAALLTGAALALAPTPSRAEKPDAADSAKVQSCIKSAQGRERERCIGVVADPCADDDKAQSTAGEVACAAREFAVWDEIGRASCRE